MMKTTLTPEQWWKLVGDTGTSRNYWFSQGSRLVDESKLQYPMNEEKIKYLFDKFYETFPNTVEIKSSNEINIGDTFIYTGEPRGTGMYIPELGAQWEIKTKDDIIHLSIEMIERGRGWRKNISSTTGH